VSSVERNTVTLAQQALEQGAVFNLNGRAKAARAAYKNAIRLVSLAEVQGVAAREVAWKAYLALGRISLKEGAFHEAVSELQSSESANPASSDSAYWLGCALGWCGRYTDSEDAFTRALDLNPEGDPIRIQRAYARVNAGRIEDALADLAVAANKGCLDERAKLLLATLYLDKGDLNTGEQKLWEICEKQSAQPAAILMLGRLLEKRERYAEAITVYLRAAQFNEVAAFAYARLGVLFARSQKYRHAFLSLKAAIERGQVDNLILFYYVLVASKLGRYADSVNAWEFLQQRSERENDRLLNPHALWGQSYILNNGSVILSELCLRAAAQNLNDPNPTKQSEAFRLLEKGKKAAPEDRRFSYCLGLLLLKAGDPGKASLLFCEAIKQGPNINCARACLILCAVRLGNIAQALDQWNRLDPREIRDSLLKEIKQELVALLVRNGRWSETADFLQSLAGKKTDQDNDLLAESFFRSGRIIELRALTGSSPWQCYWQAVGLARDGEVERAILMLRHIKESYPDFKQASKGLRALQHLQALHFAERGEWKAAASIFNEVRSMGELETCSPVLVAVIFILGGCRREAMALLEEVQHREPCNPDVAHALAILYYHTVRAGEGNIKKEWPNSVRLLHRTIATWTSLLHNDAFWKAWKEDLSVRYRLTGSASSFVDIQTTVRDRLKKMLIDLFEKHPQLILLLQRELKASDCLAEIGGFPLPVNDRFRFICGPLMIQNLDLDHSFGVYLETFSPVRRKKLIRYFSSLGSAQALIDLNRPREALESLESLLCSRCVLSLPPSNQELKMGGWIPISCRSGCPDFDRMNPGYAGVPEKYNAVCKDAAGLAVDAYLGLAQESMVAGRIDFESVREYWLQSIRLARYAERQTEVKKEIHRMTFGRVRTLEARSRFNEAITLLELVEALWKDDTDAELIGRRAKLLTARGIEAGNRTPPLWSAAVSDLRRALKYNPYSTHTLVNLNIALQSWASELYERAEMENALGLLQECLTVLRDTPLRAAGNVEIEKQYQNVRENLANFYNSWAVDLANNEKFEQALEVLDQGLRLFPGNPTMLQNQKQIGLAYPAKESLRVLDKTAGPASQADVLEYKYGGREALAFHREAVAAFNSENFKDAIDFLRQAIEVSGRPDQLQKDLSLMLTMAAAKTLKTQGGKIAPSELPQLRRMLVEAERLNPGNIEVRIYLQLLRQIEGGSF
jgi:tetratricopeptide (TPR) repeat protein